METVDQSAGLLEDGEEPSAHKPHGAELLGVLPGATRRNDLMQSPIWKNIGHEEVVDGFTVLTYQIEDLPEMPFIQILLKDDLVEGIVVHLKEPRELVDARTSFDASIKNVRPITIQDEEGNFREVYPEKGFAFILEPAADKVSASTRVIQLVAEQVRAEYFVLRAEEELNNSLQNAMSDARHALLHDPQNAPANWILAELESTNGNFLRARNYAIAAVKTDKSTVQYQLTLVNILKELGEIENAAKILDIVEPDCEGVSWFKGVAMTLRGDLLRLQQNPDYDKAIECHQKAFEIVKPYTLDESMTSRVTAKKLAVKAHLGLARDIAAKKWEDAKDKEAALAWLDAACAIAKDLIEKESEDSMTLFEVCCAATELGLDVPNVASLEPYFQLLDETSDTIIKRKSVETTDTVRDPFVVDAVNWLGGKANANIMLIYKATGNGEKAVGRGEKALALLDSVVENRPTEDGVECGVVMFHLAEIYNSLLSNDQAALTWYDRAAISLIRISPDLTPKRLIPVGKNLINMSHAYWKKGRQEEALQCTKTGAVLLQKAADTGLCPQSDLFVPYSNLATMYKTLGDKSLSEKFAKLAGECK